MAANSVQAEEIESELDKNIEKKTLTKSHGQQPATDGKLRKKI